MTILLSDVLADCEFTPLQQRTLLRLLDIGDSGEISLQQTMGLWVASLIHRLPFLGVDQRNLLLEELIPDIGEMEAAGNHGSIPMVIIGDGRYALWTGRTSWLDLQTGEDMGGDLNFLECVTYNLPVLFHQRRTILEERQRARSHEAEKRSSDDG